MTLTPDANITIIGGGVVGHALAYSLARAGHSDVALLERSPRIPGENQSSRNSGVIHAGIYYPRETMPLKARFCVEGNRLLYAFCAEHRVPHRRTGKLVVATGPEDEAYLEDVERVAADNGVPGVRRLDASEARGLEPSLRVRGALLVPSSGVVEPTMLVRALHRRVAERGVYFLSGNALGEVSPGDGCFRLRVRAGSSDQEVTTRVLINAAGLDAPAVARMVDPESPYVLNPRRGEMMKFRAGARSALVMGGRNVYPVPHGIDEGGRRLQIPFPEFQELFLANKIKKTVGVHLTPVFTMKDDEYVLGEEFTVGPFVVGGVDKDDLATSVAPEAFVDRVASFFPGLRPEDLSFHQTGMTAQLRDVPDFVIQRDRRYPDCIHLIGIESPGLTSALAIGNYVAEELLPRPA